MRHSLAATSYYGAQCLTNLSAHFSFSRHTMYRTGSGYWQVMSADRHSSEAGQSPEIVTYIRLRVHLVLGADSKPRMKALTLSQIEARVEDPTVALKQLIKDHK